MATSKRTPSPPYFQFYPRDFLLSRRVTRMSMTERGVYITLLAMCWIDGGLDTDLDRIAAALRLKPSKFRTMWVRGALAECFTEKSGRLVNVRLEQERAKIQAANAKKSAAAALRWHKEAPDEQTRCTAIQIRSDTETDTEQSRAVSVEPQGDSTPIVLTFPTSGHPNTWNLHQSRVETWAGMYPGVDVVAECRKACAWIDAATNRKTARGMPAFLVRWLNKAADRPTPTAATASKLPAWVQKARAAQ